LAMGAPRSSTISTGVGRAGAVCAHATGVTPFTHIHTRQAAITLNTTFVYRSTFIAPPHHSIEPRGSLGGKRDLGMSGEHRLRDAVQQLEDVLPRQRIGLRPVPIDLPQGKRVGGV